MSLGVVTEASGSGAGARVLFRTTGAATADDCAVRDDNSDLKQSHMGTQHAEEFGLDLASSNQPALYSCTTDLASSERSPFMY